MGQAIDNRTPDERISHLESLVDKSYEESAAWQSVAEMLWTVVANVSGSDWSKQSQEWQTAASKYRDEYYALVDKYERKSS